MLLCDHRPAFTCPAHQVADVCGPRGSDTRVLDDYSLLSSPPASFELLA